MNSVEDSVVVPHLLCDTLEPQEPVALSFCPVFAGTSDDSSLTVTMINADPLDGSERWYDPITGRWLSNDPIGISGGLNQYVFCGNNPVNFTDPFGLDRWVIDNLHTYIVVEVYMRLKGLPPQVIGYKRIDYSIRGVEVNWTTKPGEDAGNYSRKMKSSCDEDQVLLDTAEQLAKLPWYKLPYSPLFFNCRHFTASMRDVGLDAGFKSMWFPLLPPVLPGLP